MTDQYRSVVILGAARSGTKFFRKILAAPPHFRETPFDSNHIWRIGNSRTHDDALDPDTLRAGDRRAIQKALWRIALKGSSPEGQVLVEKTVSNTLRPAFVDRVLPASRYLVLFRDGRDVVESTFRMWQTPPESTSLKQKLVSLPPRALPYAMWYAGNMLVGKLSGRGVRLWGVRYPGIEADLKVLSLEEICAKQWVTCVESTLTAMKSTLDGRSFVIRYEKLVEDDTLLDAVGDFLDLATADVHLMKEIWTESKNPPGCSRWESTFSPTVRSKIQSIILPTQKKLGYE